MAKKVEGYIKLQIPAGGYDYTGSYYRISGQEL